MIAKVVDFLLFCVCNAHFVDNVLHTAAFDAIVTKLKRIDCSVEQLKSICAFVHQIDLCQHANRSFALRVDLSRNFKRVRVREVCVGGGECEDESVRLLNVGVDEAANLGFNVTWLALHRHLSQAWEINKCQIQHVW